MKHFSSSGKNISHLFYLKLIRNLLLSLCFLTSVISYAQSNDIRVTLQVLPPYSPYLADYLMLQDKVVIILNNTSNESKNIYLKASLTSNNGFNAQTQEGYKPNAPITMTAGSMYQLPANSQLYDFFNANNIDIDYGNFSVSDVLRDGILPDGTYTLCIDVFDYNTDEQLSLPNVGCKNIFINYLSPPQLLMPDCSHDPVLIKANMSNIPFSWMPVNSNVPGLQFKYDLYIAFLNENDNPQDVIENGIATGGFNVTKISDITSISYNVNFSNVDLKIGKYAWAVKARTANGNYPINNDGLSNVCTFDLAQGMMQMMMNGNANLGPDCSCKSNLPGNLTPVAANAITVGTKVTTSHFEMEVKTIYAENGLYSGTGSVPLPLLNSSLVRIKVNFSNIGIKNGNGAFIHTSGIIKANIASDASFLPEFDPFNPSSMNLSPGQITSLGSFFEDNANQLVSSFKTFVNSGEWSLPIGLDENAINIAITNLVLMPEQGYFDAIAVLDIIDGNKKVGLVGQGICIDENDFCGNVKLFLADNIDIPGINLKLVGGVGTPNENEPTSITFDKKGFNNLHIHAKYTFPNATLVDLKTNNAASVDLISDTKEGWSDWIAEVKFTSFYIYGSKDFVFGPDGNDTPIYYDHSDKRNPQGIPSPYKSGDQGDPDIETNLPTWRGFYIPSISLSLPPSLSNVNGMPIVVKAEKLIFDGGITGNVSVNNILSINDGSLDGWYYSIDRFKIDFWKNTFKSSSLSGKIVLPVSTDYTLAKNQLDYTCTLSKPQGGGLDFNFLIQPKSNIDFNIFWATGIFTTGTNIQISRLANQKFVASAVLFGQLTLKSEIKDFPDVKLAEVNFINLKFQTQKPYFQPGESNFSLASPQHSIAGFSIDIDAREGKGITPFFDGTKIGLKFNVLLKLVADVDFVPKAEVEFDAYGSFTMNGIRPAWDGLGAQIDRISLDAEAKIGPIGVMGTLGYYNDHVGSYGFFGALRMGIDDLIDVEAKAQFGYQKENQGGFNYFFIDAMVDLKNAGIPIPPAMAIYGFKGGVYYNMSLNNINTTKDVDVSGAKEYKHDFDNPQPGVTLSGLQYVPTRGKFSLTAGVLFGLITGRNILDADGSLTVEINMQRGGIETIMFNLNGRFITDIKEPLMQRNANCMGKGSLDIEMNFTDKSLLFHVGLVLGVPSHTANPKLLYASADVDFYSGPSGWFIHIGRPWTTAGDADGNNITGGSPIELRVFGIKFMGYFQCGKGTGQIFRNGSKISGITAVDEMPPIPYFIMNIISHNKLQGDNGRVDNSLSSVNGNDISKRIEGGVVFGANFTSHIDVNFLIFYLKATFMAGFDLAFYDLQKGTMCQTEDGNKQEMGINNFYAKGQAYLGAKIDVGIEVDLFFFSGKISIVEAGVAAYVQFGAPNPTYLTGAIGGYFSVLGGLIQGQFGVKFYWGEICTKLDDESISLISVLNPSADFDENNYTKAVHVVEEQSVFMQPSVTFNFEIGRTFLIIADAAEQDPDLRGQTYRQYRYYHILPSDLTFNLSGGPISSNGNYYLKPLDQSNFEVSSDQFSFVLKEPISFDSKSNFKFDVTAKVRIYNLKEASKNLSGGSSGYKTDAEMIGVANDRKKADQEWKLATDKSGDVYIDQRHLLFKTDCGIKTVNEEWVTSVEPFHRTQNNPVNPSPSFNSNDLRTSFTPTYTTNFKIDNRPASKPKVKLTMDMTSKNYTLELKVSWDLFNEKRICTPPGFESGFDYFLKVSTFDKSSSGSSFNKQYYKAIISADKSSISAKLDKPLPIDNYIVVQVILKKLKNSSEPSNNQLMSSLVLKKSYQGMIEKLAYNTSVNYRTIGLDSKLAPSSSEMELFRWYFTTGKYSTYQDKMADLDITVDTITTTYRYMQDNKNTTFGYSSGSKNMIRDNKFKVIQSTFNFLGKEKFDFHDLYNYNINSVFENGANIPFDKKLASKYLGYAFDNKSQELVDRFLRLYFENDEVRSQFLIAVKGTYESNEMGIKILNNYITDKMFDENIWKFVKIESNVLRPMDKLPSDLFYGDKKYSFTSINVFSTKMFSIIKESKIIASAGSETTIIPSHIINMKNLKDNLPGNGSIVFQSYLSDAMNDFNRTVYGQVTNSFNPIIINNKFPNKR